MSFVRVQLGTLHSLLCHDADDARDPVPAVAAWVIHVDADRLCSAIRAASVSGDAEEKARTPTTATGSNSNSPAYPCQTEKLCSLPSKTVAFHIGRYGRRKPQRLQDTPSFAHIYGQSGVSSVVSKAPPVCDDKEGHYVVNPGDIIGGRCEFPATQLSPI